jgi:hypothetical protein
MLKLATKFIPRQPYFETAYRAGFRNAELWLDAAVLADREAVVPLARHYPNRYVPHFPNRLEQTPATLEHAAGLYRELGCRCLVIHQPLFERYHEALLRLEPAMRLAVENHKYTPEAFAHWSEKYADLTLDVEHLWKYTLRDAPLPELLKALRDFLARHGHKLRHVHLPGYQPGSREHRPMYSSREMIFPVLSLLAEHSFEGLIVSEVSTDYQNANDLRMDVLLFDTWRTQHDPLAAG